MKIISLHIYGFGKFQDKVIDEISDHFHLFYGDNEAGKSTILAFIRSILFGFPTKQQKDERFEPKFGSAYGGKLTVDIENYGLVTIERTRGKATGDVKLYLPSGNTGTEEDLNRILGGMDRSLFQVIFSFDLKELNDISQIQSEELGEFLYGVGMSGRSSIIDLEKDITKKQEELFKPKGKNPILNQALVELEQMSKKLHELREEEKIYAHDVRNVIELEKLIQNKQKDKRVIKEKIKELEKLKQIGPLFTRKKALSFQIDELNRSIQNFPVDGITQLEEYDVKCNAIREQIMDIEKKKELLEEKLSGINCDQRILYLEEDINKLQRNLAKYEELLTNKQTVQQAIIQGEKNLKQLLEFLGEEWNEERIQECSTTLHVKEEIKDRIENIRRLQDQIQSLNVEIDRRNILCNEKSLQENTIKKSLVTISQIEELKQNLNGVYQKQKEKERLVQEMTLLKAEVNQSKQKKKPIPMYLLILLFLAFGLWSFLNTQWIYTAISIAAVLILLWYLRDVGYTTGKSKQYEQLKALEKLYESHTENNLEEIQKEYQEKLRAAEENTRRYEHIVSEREFEESFLAKLTDKLHISLNQLNVAEEDFINWARNIGFIELKNPVLMVDIFSTIVDAKKIIEQIREDSNQLKKWTVYEEQLISIGEELSIACNLNTSSNLVFIADKSMEIMKIEQEKDREKRHLQDMIKELCDQLRLLEGKASIYQEKREELFESVAVADEQEFRLLAIQFTEKNEMQKELLQVNAQLYSYCSDEDEQLQLEQKWNASSQELDQLEELENNFTELDEQIRAYENELIEKKLKLSHLENATTYTQLAQQFEIKKSEFQQKARQWAVYQMSLKFIEEAKKIYETKRQPFVLQKGSEFFQIMTNGKYPKLYAPVGESTFIVENIDGVRFTPNELSRGTAEQLYLSLRFAMACVYQSHIPFPIIMDDILVNFDAKRREGARKVIEMMAVNHQILFFTCHQHMVHLFKDQELLVMS